MTTAPTRRVNRGRGHRYVLDGDHADGVTWVLSNGVPKPALVGWAANTTADYATDHWEELEALKQSERNAVLRKARWDTTKEAAVRGTDVHTLAHKLLAGEEVDVPEPLIGYVDACILFLREWHAAELVTEAIVLNRQHRYMGTLDLIAILSDGLTWLLDWKTGGKGIFREAALQLAAYRNAEAVLTLGHPHLPDYTEVPMPPVDACGCVWLRADGSYDLIPVNTEPHVFKTFLHAAHVARFTDAPSEDFIGEAQPHPERIAAA